MVWKNSYILSISGDFSFTQVKEPQDVELVNSQKHSLVKSVDLGSACLKSNPIVYKIRGPDTSSKSFAPWFPFQRAFVFGRVGVDELIYIQVSAHTNDQ